MTLSRRTPSHSSLPPVSLLLAVFLLMSPSPSQALLVAIGTNVYDGITQVEEQESASWPHDPVNYPGSVAGMSAHLSTVVGLMSAEASAGPMTLHVGAQGFWGTWTTPPVAEFAGAEALVEDRFTIIDPSGMHAGGNITVRVGSSGFWHEDGGSLQFTLQAGICGVGFVCPEIYAQGAVTDGVESGFSPFQIFSSNTVFVPFNQQLGVGMFFSVSGGRQTNNPGSFIADFFSTVSWGGLEIVDDNGQPITGLEIVSASGVNWLNAAPISTPDPGVVWLLATAAGALALRRYRF